MKKSKPAVVIFAREPVLGTVKSRLSQALDEAERLNLYKRMVTHTSVAVSHMKRATVFLCSTPDKQHPFLSTLSKRFNFHQQVQADGDLGHKMSEAFKTVLHRSGQAILIGSDCPFITSDYLGTAIAELNGNPVIVGPATDGGFVMIGTTDHTLMKPLFRNIEWGSGEVLVTLLKNAEIEGINVHLMEPLNDIDRPEDLKLLDGFTWFE